MNMNPLFLTSRNIRRRASCLAGNINTRIYPIQRNSFHTVPSSKIPNLQQKLTYYLPHESKTHLATILAFPSRYSVPPSHYRAAQQEIIDLAATISTFEPVHLYARPEDAGTVQRMLRERSIDSRGINSTSNENVSDKTGKHQIDIRPCPTNHCWVRDTGPVYVAGSDGGRHAIDFNFCEWGEKYFDPNDTESEEAGWLPMNSEQLLENTQFARRVIESDLIPSPVTRVESTVRLEGGGIEVDGEGTLMATESSILCNARNPDLTKDQVERELKRVLGVEKVIWLPGRRNLDITDCHIDAEARFVRPGVVVVSRPYSHKKSWASRWNEVYDEICEVLRRETDARGRKLAINVVQEPDPRYLVGSSLVNDEDAPAASYVNFYFVNGGLILPRFGDPVADEAAVEMYRRLLPERVVKTVHVNSLPRMGGVLHCVTQQIPLVVGG